MAIQDPFDRVLTKLGVYQHMQDMRSIRTAARPATTINTLEVPCRVRGRAFHWPNVPDEVRYSPTSTPSRFQVPELALKFIKYIHPIRTSLPGEATRTRLISLLLGLDGTVQAEPIRMLVDISPGVYPARYRIPPSMIKNLRLEEQVWRAEKFALGTLLYELYTGQIIFDGQSDIEIQDQYRTAATFPNLELLQVGLPAHMQCLIYACWSAEFGRYFTRGPFTQYVEDNPVRFAFQVTGAVVSTAAFLTVPILGAIGFSAIGPVAGSVAAGWQASIGAVEAGSLFALFQSMAMGGAAAAGLATTGASGAAVALVASGLPSLSNPTLAAPGFPSPSELRDVFIHTFREGPRN